jgi:hypothetical protein
MDRADDVVAGELAAPLQHEGLAMATDVRQHLHVLAIVDQHLGAIEELERVIVIRLGHHQLMAGIARAVLEQMLQFEFVNDRIEIPGHRQLRRR